MPRYLRNLSIREVSSVDRGAGKGVKVVLMKRAESGSSDSRQPEKLSKKLTTYLARNLFDEAAAEAKTQKRDFSSKERRRLAGTGAALPDGSFPISTEQDLKNAIRAVGRASDPGKARSHIISRARSMGLSSILPAKWTGAKKRLRKQALEWVSTLELKKSHRRMIEKALDFNASQANQETQEWADGMVCEVREAVCSLQSAICSIMCDDTVTDKQAAVEATFKQFYDHLKGVVPEGVEQALQAATLIAEGAHVNPQGAVQLRDGGTQMAVGDMNQNEMSNGKGKKKMRAMKAKNKALKVARKALKADVTKLGQQIVELEKKVADTSTGDDQLQKRLAAVMKLSPEHRTWLFHAGNSISTPDQLAFLDASVEKRDEMLKETPVEKLEEHRLSKLAPEVREAIEKSAKAEKMATESADASLRVEMTKRATDLALPATFAEHFLAVHKASPDALKEIERVLKGFDAQTRTAVIFKEFGTAQGDPDADSAHARVEKRIDAMMKAENPPKSRNSALGKIAASTEPTDQTLWQEYKEESGNGNRKAA